MKILITLIGIVSFVVGNFLMNAYDSEFLDNIGLLLLLGGIFCVIVGFIV